MVQASPTLTFDEFLKLYPEDSRYELVNGQIMSVLATRQHEDIADFIADAFKEEVKLHKLNYKISDQIVLATETETGTQMGRTPDVSIVDRTMWRLNRSAYTALREPIRLAVEVVSTNWEDDYENKFDEYQRLGVFEYWIVDYLALGSRRHLGNPKEPAVFVHVLDANHKYRSTRFRADERIVSPTFSNLELTLNEILEAEG